MDMTLSKRLELASPKWGLADIMCFSDETQRVQHYFWESMQGRDYSGGLWPVN